MLQSRYLAPDAGPPSAPSSGWNLLPASASSWLLRLTSVTLPPWVMLVTYLPPVSWDLLRRTGLATRVRSLVPVAATLLRDLLRLVGTAPILTTLTRSWGRILSSLSRLLLWLLVLGCS